MVINLFAFFQNETENKNDTSQPQRKSLFERIQYVADNAKNDPNAPSYFKGLFKGYLAFDTSQKFHYRWLCVINCAVLYNLIFVVGRAVFWELQNIGMVSNEISIETFFGHNHFKKKIHQFGMNLQM